MQHVHVSERACSKLCFRVVACGRCVGTVGRLSGGGVRKRHHSLRRNRLLLAIRAIREQFHGFWREGDCNVLERSARCGLRPLVDAAPSHRQHAWCKWRLAKPAVKWRVVALEAQSEHAPSSVRRHPLCTLSSLKITSHPQTGLINRPKLRWCCKDMMSCHIRAPAWSHALYFLS